MVSQDVSLKGNLRSFSFGEILQTLAFNRRSGVLEITVPGDKTRAVYFREGLIIGVQPEAYTPFRLGEVLVARRKLGADDLRMALDIQAKTKEPLGLILTAKGFVTEEEIAEALSIQLQEQLYDFFLLKEGEFRFRPFEGSQEEEGVPSQTDRLLGVAVSVDPQLVSVEAARLADEWETLRNRVPSFDAVFVKTDKEEGELTEIQEQVYRLVDGKSTVKELARAAILSLLRCSCVLAELVGAEKIRLLTTSELIKRAEEEAEPERRTSYLSFALFQEPENPNLRILLADAYIKSGKRGKATETLREGLAVLPADKSDARRSLAQALLSLNATDPAALEVMSEIQLQSGNEEEAFRLALKTAQQYQRNDPEKALEVLSKVTHIVPDNLECCFEAASLLRTLGAGEKALPHLEVLAQRLEAQGKLEQAIKALSWIVEADPTRADARFRLDRLRSRSRQARAARKRRLITGVAVALVVIIAASIPLASHIKAKQAFAQTCEKEKVLLEERNFDEAVSLWRTFLSKYPSGSWGERAKQALKRVSDLKEQAEIERRKAIEEEKKRLESLQQQANELLRLAKEKEAKGDLAGAYDALRLLLGQFPGSPQAKAARFPLRLTSSPAGALVKRTSDGTTLGRTPLVLHYRPGEKVELSLSHPGCSTITWQLTADYKWEAHVKLPWSPTGRFSLPIPVTDRLVPQGRAVFLSSRDGHLYFIDPKLKAVRWRRKIGYYGDPASRFLLQGDKLYVGNLDGIFWCLKPSTGKKIWSIRLPGAAVRKPVATRDGNLVLVTSEGDVCILRSGAIYRQTSVLGRVVTDPLLFGDTLFVGTEADLCYAIDPQLLKVKWRRSVDADVIGGPIAAGGHILVVTKRKEVILFDPQSGDMVSRYMLPAPLSGEPVLHGLSAWLPLDDGTLAEVRPGRNNLNLCPAGSAPIRTVLPVKRYLVLGDSEGKLCLFDPAKRAVRWAYETPAPVEARPCLYNDNLLFATKKGEFFYMLLLE